MKCFAEVISAPTADTPGTTLLLHFDNCRYLVGNVSEGTQRACIERGIGLRKVSAILLTGRTEWSNLGGLLGLVLELADIKHIAQSSLVADTLVQPAKIPAELSSLDIYGTTNLNHMIATSRRFIFRRGMPMNTIEFGEDDDRKRLKMGCSTPTWEDERIKVWTMVLQPQAAPKSKASPSSPLKRSYDQLTTGDEDLETTNRPESDPFMTMRKAIVSRMFNSDWKLDNLMPRPLSQVKLPAKIFVRDADTRQLKEYNGPLPGGKESVPEITVWVREPWPATLTEHLPPSKPSLDAVSYIIRNHPQRGRFLPEKALRLRVPKGRLWSKLAGGHTVQNELGEDVTPESVLAPGKQGGGFAVVDLPSVDYINPLVARPEWQCADVMDGVEAIVWILGPGVALDDRMRKFQTEMGRLTQIVASPDCCANTLALEEVATNNLRHRFIDDTVFPLLQHSPMHDQEIDERVSQPLPGTVAAQRGQVIILEPRVELQTQRVKEPLDLPSLQAKIAEEFRTLGMSPEVYSSVLQDTERDAWKTILPYGDTEIIILGTGSSHPSKCRNVSGTLIRVPGCGAYLLDCGEGTLGTLRRMFSEPELDAILRDLKMIWISHLHADHHLGTASLIKAWTLATEPTGPRLDERTAQSGHVSDKELGYQRLAVVSDAPMLQWLHEYGSAEDLGLQRVLPLATTPSRGSENLGNEQNTLLTFVTADLSPLADQDFSLTAQYLDTLNLKALNSVYVNHCRGAQAVSLTFKNGLKISYSGDCRPSAKFTEIGRDSHVLIHEATFQDDMRSEALAKKHSTAGEALIVAHEMKARVTILTHFSQRYPEMPRLGAQVRRREGSPPLHELRNILEEQDEAQPSASMTELLGSEQQDNTNGNHSSAAGRSKASTDHVVETLGSGLLRRAPTGYLELIDEENIKDLLSASGMKVVFGFDYMRLKLKNVPLLEAKQPLLRRMYDEGIGKDALHDIDASDGPDVSGNTREQKEAKKRAKADKMNQQRLENEKRARSSEDKWAEAARLIAER